MPRYTPNPTSEIRNDTARLVEYLDNELRRLSTVINLLVEGRADVLHAEPPRPRQGMMVYADGTDWNPGSGEGLYRHNGSAWVFIG